MIKIIPEVPDEILLKHNTLAEWNILLAYRGSISHGMYIPSDDPNSIDDKDLMGVCVPPLNYYFGLHGHYGQLGKGTKEIKENDGEWDIVVYEVKKLIRLLGKGNPNVLSLLWVEDKHYIHVSPEGQMLLDNRDLFVSKKVYAPFAGYATAQLKKMEKSTFNGYMGERRKALVEKYGYDTKNASHLIRLLRMGIEFLDSGELQVARHNDAAELLAIKSGEWSLDRVKTEASLLFEEARYARDNSKLPDAPDLAAIDKLCVDIVKSRLKL